MSEEKNDRGESVATALPKTYVEWRDPFPAVPPSVKLIFHGLFCVFFRGSDFCFVGTHNTTREPGNPHTASHPHHYEIIVVRKDSGEETGRTVYPAPDGNPIRVPRLNVNATGSAFPGGAAPGVYAYTGPNHAQFSRSDRDDSQDWRWIIDFEDRMYPQGVRGKRAGTIMPGVKIDNGLFHTHRKTVAHFDLIPEGGGEPIPLNSVAEIVAANIYLAPGGHVRLTGGPVGELTLEQAENRVYEVCINNLCDGSVHPGCDYDSTSDIKEERNDFFLYYETFNKALNPPEYMLVNRGNVDPSTDDAPCGAVGYNATTEP